MSYLIKVGEKWRPLEFTSDADSVEECIKEFEDAHPFSEHPPVIYVHNRKIYRNIYILFVVLTIILYLCTLT